MSSFTVSTRIIETTTINGNVVVVYTETTLPVIITTQTVTVNTSSSTTSTSSPSVSSVPSTSPTTSGSTATLALPSSASSDPGTTSSSRSPQTGVIIGCTIAGVLVAGIIIWRLLSRRRSSHAQRELRLRAEVDLQTLRSPSRPANANTRDEGLGRYVRVDGGSTTEIPRLSSTTNGTRRGERTNSPDGTHTQPADDHTSNSARVPPAYDALSIRHGIPHLDFP